MVVEQLTMPVSDADLREKLKASTDAAQLHALIAHWQSAQLA